MRAAAATTVQAPKAWWGHIRERPGARSRSGARLVHFLRQKELAQRHHEPYEGPAEDRYREFEQRFEALHGPIVGRVLV